MLVSHHTSFIFLSLLLPNPFAAAYDPANHKKDGLYLTSFQWCGSGLPDDDGGDRGCSFPENTYPYFNRNSGTNPAMLLSNKNYTVTWGGADPEYPVQVEWWAAGDDTMPATVRWTANTTADSYIFNPQSVFASFPTELSPNISAAEASRAATGLANVIIISQPDRSDSNSSSSFFYWSDTSQQFSIQNPIVSIYIQASSDRAVDEVEARWKKGVGIAVGLGVPLLLALTALVTWTQAKKRFGQRGDQAVSKGLVST
ncbi:hypothetical protein BX600DRAFT_503442 [Xylariales sp. PMI_506]|nr:hypothetical protein BX600DRAFT_503442 [Xylariales sp. PMI_506]